MPWIPVYRLNNGGLELIGTEYKKSTRMRFRNIARAADMVAGTRLNMSVKELKVFKLASVFGQLHTLTVDKHQYKFIRSKVRNSKK